MESDDDRHRLPDFTFHEACLLTVRLTSRRIPDLHIAPEPTVRDELQKRTERAASAIVQNMKHNVGRFLAGLSELNPTEFWDLDDLRAKLESLSEMQHFRLYFALRSISGSSTNTRRKRKHFVMQDSSRRKSYLLRKELKHWTASGDSSVTR